jgi:AcrR family transcriptional regulator
MVNSSQASPSVDPDGTALHSVESVVAQTLADKAAEPGVSSENRPDHSKQPDPTGAIRPGGVPRKRRSNEIDPDRIYDAAAQLLATIGPTRMTMADVARHVGISRATLYRHWANIHELINGLFDREYLNAGIKAWEADTAAYDNNPDAPSERVRLIEAVLSIAKTIRENPTWKIMVNFDSDWLVENVVRKTGSAIVLLVDLGESMITLFSTDGSIRTDKSPRDLAGLIGLMVVSFLLSGPVLMNDPEYVALDEHLRDLLDRLLGPPVVTP